ncbi:T9SS type A sorting domain-containing protein [bacterium]|nr:T9SS type A sorting domain-containing protein [bacterium]
MSRKVLYLLMLTLFVSSVAFAGNYYMVQPGGKMQKVEKIGDSYLPTRGEAPVESQTSMPMSPGFIDTTQMYFFESGYYFPDRDSNTVLLQYFKSDFACSLVAVGFTCYSAGWAAGYVWEAPDPMPETSEDLLAYHQANWEFDTIANNWVTMPTALYGPELVGSDEPGDLEERVIWLNLPTKIDIGTGYVGAGFKILTREGGGAPYGGQPWPLSDDFVDQYGFGQYEPSVTWMYRVHHIHPTLGEYHQWVDYGNSVGDWRFHYVIDIYVNAPPSFIDYTEIPGTYDTGDKTVSATLYDFGVPSEMAGVDEAKIVYWTDGAPDPVEVMMTLVDGTAEEGTWEGSIPGQTPWTTVTYYVEATDMQGVASTTMEITYVVGEGTPGRVLLYLEGDAYYGPPYSEIDAVSTDFGTDVWDEGMYGPADESVFDFYTTGAGQKGLCWIGWGGTSFAADTSLIGAFLDAGGNLFLSSQDIIGGGFNLGYGEGLVIPEGHWVQRYLGVNGVFDDYQVDESFTLYGMAGDPISDPFQAGIELTPYYWAGPGYNYAGRFDDLAEGATLIFMDGLGANMGYRYDTGVYKVVFLFWPFNYIGTWIDDSTFVEDTDAQVTLAHNVQDWMGLVGIEDSEPLKVTDRFFLHNSAPNPFVTVNTIKYAIPKTSNVSLKVYDITGKIVTTLVNEDVAPGVHAVQWNGTDWNGKKVSAGIYFYKFNAGDYKATRKTVLIR